MATRAPLALMTSGAVAALASCNLVLDIGQLPPLTVDAGDDSGVDATTSEGGHDATVEGEAGPDAAGDGGIALDATDTGIAEGGLQCESGFADCDGACIDLTTNSNCGACAVACPSMASCFDASCTCPIDTILCDGGCLDDSKDLHNCGACGTVCPADVDAGETPICVTGACRRTVVLSSTGAGPSGIAVADGSVVWANKITPNGSIVSIPVSGGAPFTIASGLSRPFYVAVDGTSVYWTDFADQEVETAPLSGGAARVAHASQGPPIEIAVDSTTVYWADLSGQVYSCPVDGGTLTPLVGGLGSAGPLAIDDANVYFADTANDIVGWLPKTGGSATEVRGDGGDQPTDIAVSGGSVYWTRSSSVQMAAIDAGVPSVLAAQGGSSLVTDGSLLYWQTGGAIVRMPIGGGPIVTIVQGQGAIGGIAFDATSLYWTLTTTGQVMKVTPR